MTTSYKKIVENFSSIEDLELSKEYRLHELRSINVPTHELCGDIYMFHDEKNGDLVIFKKKFGKYKLIYKYIGIKLP